MTPLEAEALTPFWSEADLASLSALAERLGMPVEEVLLPLASESKLDPHARNPVDPKAWPLAAGIAQFTRAAAAGMGLIPGDRDAAGKDTRSESLAAWKPLAEDILKSSVGKQLYLFELFLASTGYAKAGGVFDSAARIYQAIAAPSTMVVGVVPTKETVIYPKGSAGYDGNKALDLDNDGQVTFGDLQVAVGSMRKHPVVVAALTRAKV